MKGGVEERPVDREALRPLALVVGQGNLVDALPHPSRPRSGPEEPLPVVEADLAEALIEVLGVKGLRAAGWPDAEAPVLAGPHRLSVPLAFSVHSRSASSPWPAARK